MTPHKRRTPAALALGAFIATSLALSGCAPAVPTIERGPEGGQLPYSDLEGGYARAWNTSSTIDANRIEIEFDGWSEPTCYRHDVDVVETAVSITITLYSGRLRDAKKLPCSDLINADIPTDTMIIETEDPVGDRKTVDGTPG